MNQEMLAQETELIVLDCTCYGAYEIEKTSFGGELEYMLYLDGALVGAADTLGEGMALIDSLVAQGVQHASLLKHDPSNRGVKYCSMCQTIKKLSEFSPHRSKQYALPRSQNLCKSCSSLKRRSYPKHGVRSCCGVRHGLLEVCEVLTTSLQKTVTT